MNKRNVTTDERRERNLRNGREVDGKFAPGDKAFKRMLNATKKQNDKRQAAMDSFFEMFN